MTTTTVPIQITCPDWCTESPESHAEDLWNLGGCCDHRSQNVKIEDTAGYQEPLQEPRMHEAIRLQLAALTRPDGRPQATPLMFIGDHEHSIQQALDLADAIRALVETYRDNGGVV